jgi:hypothetical protein
VIQSCSNLVIVLAREDVKVQLHAPQTMTEQFQLCEWGHCRLGKLHRYSEIMSDHGMHLITQRIRFASAKHYCFICFKKKKTNIQKNCNRVTLREMFKNREVTAVIE